MGVAHRIETLQGRHAQLEQELGREESHMWHDQSRIVRLKHDKLRIKDEIARLRLVAGDSGSAGQREAG